MFSTTTVDFIWANATEPKTARAVRMEKRILTDGQLVRGLESLEKRNTRESDILMIVEVKTVSATDVLSIS